MEQDQVTPESQSVAASLMPAVNAPPASLTPDAAGTAALAAPITAPPAPTTGVVAPSPQAAPPPGSFAAKIGKAADTLGIPHGVGGWARSLVGSAQRALSGIETSLGDAATAAQGARPGEGSLAAVGRVRAAEQARQQAQKQAQTNEDKERAQIAHENISTLYQQQLLHKLGDDENHADIANGKAAIDMYTTAMSSQGLNPAPVIAKDITEAQIQNAIKNKNLDPSYNHIWPSGSYQPFDPQTGKPMLDKNGQPMLQKTYTVLGNVPETILSKDMAKLIKDNVPGVDLPEGTHLSGAIAGSLVQQAMSHQAVQQKIDFDRESAELAKLTGDQKIAQLKAINNLGPDFLRVFAQSGGDLTETLNYMTGQHMIHGIDPKTGKPGLVPDPGSLKMKTDKPTAGTDMLNAFGGAVEFAKIVDTQKKAAEQVRHDREKEAEDAQKEKDKKAKDLAYIGDDSLSGEAFLASLNPQEQGVVKSIGTGHVVADRLGYLLTKSPNLVAAVAKAYPDFDTSKAAGYAAMYKKFVAGPNSDTLQNASTASRHLKELFDLNTLESRIPGTADYKRYKTQLNTLVDELGKFYGTTTIPGLEGFRESLGGWMNRGAAIQQQSNAMQDKLKSLEEEWDRGAPSAAYKPQMPRPTPDVMKNLAYVQSGGKTAAPAVTGAPAAALGAPAGGDFFGNFGGRPR
jgi:hypothetical protein